MKKWFALSLVLLMILGFSVGAFASDPEKDIVDTAIEADDFDTLVAAVVEAGLVEALKGEGPFTVFAPTDEAFANLPEGALEELMEDTDALAEVLLYHVVSGKVMAADVLGLDGAEVETLQGQNVMVSLEDGKVFINDAEVIVNDTECTNGVIHVIDTVLVPEIEEEAVEEEEVVEEESVTVMLYIGSNEYEINGETGTMDVDPFIEADRTFVPLRFVGEAFGAEFDWTPKDAPTEVVTLTREGMTVTINIGSQEITVMEDAETRTITADVAAQIVEDRTFLPLRAVGEIFGAEFDWGPKDALTEWVSYTIWPAGW